MAETYLTDCADRAQTALSQSAIFDLRRLSVQHDGEAVVLCGKVGSFYHKQLAQEIVRGALDGAEVVNEINVVYRGDDSVLDW